ncbi:MAG: VanZ family protein [Patescibacteria group bacterium]
MSNALSPAIYLKAYLPVAAWALTIFILSSQGSLPGFSVSAADFVFKKSAHMFVYAVLYYLFWRAVQKTHPTPTTSQTFIHWALPLGLTLLYAASDELHQTFVPYRYGTIRDVGYDMLGACIVFLRQYRYI